MEKEQGNSLGKVFKLKVHRERRLVSMYGSLWSTNTHGDFGNQQIKRTNRKLFVCAAGAYRAKNRPYDPPTKDFADALLFAERIFFYLFFSVVA